MTKAERREALEKAIREHRSIRDEMKQAAKDYREQLGMIEEIIDKHLDALSDVADQLELPIDGVRIGTEAA